MRLPPLVPRPMPVRVFDHDDAGVDHGADRDRDPAQRHDVQRQPLQPHNDHREQDPHRKGDYGHQTAPQVGQKQQTHETHDQHLLSKTEPDAADSAIDQRRAVIGDLQLDALGQARTDLLQPGLHIPDHAPGVGSEPHDHDPAHRLPFPVPLGQPAAALRPDAHPRHVLQQDRRAVRTHPESDPADVVQRPDVPEPPDHELLLGDLDQAASNIVVALLDRRADR